MDYIKLSILSFVFLNFTFCDMLANPVVDTEIPIYKKELTEKYFSCQTDNECVIVQGWCSTFSINQYYLKKYQELSSHTKNSFSNQYPLVGFPQNLKLLV